jgi:hypothetical protein
VSDATPRYHACVKADQDCVDAVLNSGLAPEKYDKHRVVWITLISGAKHEFDTVIALSCLIPRSYLIIHGEGWEDVLDKDGRMAKASILRNFSKR